MLRSALIALWLLSSAGCSVFKPLRLEPIATSVQKPSNVAVYVAATERGKPLTSLQPENFRIYENGQLLRGEDAAIRVLPQELAVYQHTLLLVDVSGEPGSLEPLARAVAGFVESVQRTQPVSVVAFDGRAGLHPVAEFPKSAQALPADLRGLATLGQRDGSRNLNGALRSALEQLDARLARQAKPLKIGTLVVFTRGPDLAGRVSRAQADAALSETQHSVLAVGIAGQAESTLAELGKDGIVKAQDAGSLGIAFEEAARVTRDLYEKHYLIAYCSPGRAGMRRLEVEVRYRDREGDESVASFSKDFDATGFGPGCRSDSPPRFVGPGSPSELNAAPAARPAEDERVVLPPANAGYAP